MVRTEFIGGLVALATYGAAGVPNAQPAGSPGPQPSDASGDDPSQCRRNPILPYDRKLAMRESTLDGPDFDLIRYRGFAVWINLFATWCEPCRDEQAEIQAVATAYFARGLRTFGMFSDESDDVIRRYRKTYALTYPLVRDASGNLVRNLEGGKQTTFPAHLFITGAGTLSCYEVGTLPRSALEARIESLLTTVGDPLPLERG